MTSKTLSVLLLGTWVFFAASMEMKEEGAVGGSLSEEKSADENVKTLLGKLNESLQSQIQSKSCGIKVGTEASSCVNATKFEVIAYKTQVVSGTNYYVKVQAMDDAGMNVGIYHVKIYEQPWNNILEISAVDGPKEDKVPITSF